MDEQGSTDSISFLGKNFPLEVIELVLLQVDVESLKSCRLVCKAWNKEAVRLLQSQVICKMEIQFGDEILFYCSKYTNLKDSATQLSLPSILGGIRLRFFDNSVSELRKFFTLWPWVTQMIHWTRFIHLGSPRDYSYHNQPNQNSSLGTYQEDMGWIFQRTSPNLYHLDLSPLDDAVDVFAKCIDPIVSFPCLTSLTATARNPRENPVDDVQDRQGRLQRSVELIEDIARKSPQLKSLRIRGDSRRSPLPAVHGLISHFQGILELEIPAQSLVLQGILNPNQGHGLSRLKSLVLNCIQVESEARIFRILSRFTSSLIHLKLQNFHRFCVETRAVICPAPSFEDEEGLEGLYLDFPRFPLLTRLEVTNFDLEETYLQNLPGLKHLGVTEELVIRHLPKDLTSYPSVTSIAAKVLELSEEKQLRRAAVEALVGAFPNVRCWRIKRYCEAFVDLAVASARDPERAILEQFEGEICQSFPPGPLKGLRWLKIHFRPGVELNCQSNFSEETKELERLKKHDFLPDLTNLSYKRC